MIDSLLTAYLGAATQTSAVMAGVGELYGLVCSQGEAGGGKGKGRGWHKY